jgi:hypothetical protein
MNIFCAREKDSVRELRMVGRVRELLGLEGDAAEAMVDVAALAHVSAVHCRA